MARQGGNCNARQGLNQAPTRRAAVPGPGEAARRRRLAVEPGARPGYLLTRLRLARNSSRIVGQSLRCWAVRTIEARMRPGLLGERWAWFAYRNWMRLYRFDRDVLSRFVPRRAFYNLLLYAERAG